MRAMNIVLIAVLLLLGATTWALRIDPSQRNVEFLPDMARPVSVQSFSANPNLPHGMTEQPPVAGTVLYHTTPLHYGATKEEAIRAGVELTNPFTKNAAAANRGAVVYANFCLPCHGPSGRGDGTVAQRGFPTPPSLLAPNARGLADGRIFHILTYGQGNMPSYASQIAPDDRWRAVTYVRVLQQKEK